MRDVDAGEGWKLEAKRDNKYLRNRMRGTRRRRRRYKGEDKEEDKGEGSGVRDSKARQREDGTERL